MKIFLIILAIIYGLTSLLIFLLGIISAHLINYPKKEIKPTLPKFVGYLFMIVWSVLPILRWLVVVGVAKNYQEYGAKN